MSYYETPEQRQARLMRSRIDSLNTSINNLTSANATLRAELDRVRRQQSVENAKLETRLRSAIKENEKIRGEMNDSVRQLDRKLKEAERLHNQRIAAMQNAHQAQMQNMQQTFQNEYNSLNGQIQSTRQEMTQQITRVREETDRKLRTQREETLNIINQESSRLQGQINAVDQNVRNLAQSIRQRAEDSKNLAVYWQQEAARLLAQIKESFRPQIIDRRREEHIRRDINNAISFIESGNYDSAITAGTNAFYSALDMKEDLAAAELEWNFWFNSVKTRQAQLIEDIAAAESREYEIDTPDGKVRYTNGIDYWTYGQFSTFKERQREAFRRIEAIDDMTLEQLQSSEEEIRSLQEQLALIENTSHSNVAMSMLRYQMAANIGEILGEKFRMVDADGEFFAREDREEYHAIFSNPQTNDRVAVVITPIPDEKGVVTNHVDLLMGSADNDPQTRRNLEGIVAQRLRESGVEGCKFPCSSRFDANMRQEVARVTDMEAVEAGKEKARANVPGVSTSTNSNTVNVRRVTKN